MTTQVVEVSTAAVVELAVRQAHEEAGFTLPDGKLDTAKLRQRVLDVIARDKVLAWNERKDKAVTKGTLVATLYPGVPGPDEFDSQDDPRLAQEVWKKITTWLWNETKPNATSALQRLVGVHLGNGYVLCRTKVGRDRADAAYITDDRECIEKDFIAPESASLNRKYEQVIADREMLMTRQPQNARRYARNLERSLKALNDNAKQRVALTLSSTVSVPSDEDDEN